MKYYYFLDTDHHIIRIESKRKPSEKTIPRLRGTWIVYEYHPEHIDRWCMACFPEITWPRLSQMKYIGSVAYDPTK